VTTALVPAKSTMTERDFGMVFSKLAIQLRWVDADVASVKSYYEALKEFALPVMETTARAFATEAGRKFFPTTAEWYEAATAARARQFRDALEARPEPWHLECERCEDTGWAPHTCDGSNVCGRSTTHAAHPYVSVCPCRPTNRTFLRHQMSGSGAA
jgi:hypothetical protein